MITIFGNKYTFDFIIKIWVSHETKDISLLSLR